MGEIRKLLLVYLLLLFVLLTACNEKEDSYEPVIGYKGEDYERIYSEIQNGMTKTEVFALFEGDPDSPGEPFIQGGISYETIVWVGDDGSNIGCDFVEHICNFKQGWTLEGGYERESPEPKETKRSEELIIEQLKKSGSIPN
ncbi:hypothetical protein [Oceanobacillus zhaokaii]|nr:hypothetical protein [Oceanobacillus zhaokaii]